jgi:hypothetical protein
MVSKSSILLPVCEPHSKSRRQCSESLFIQMVLHCNPLGSTNTAWPASASHMHGDEPPGRR